MNNMTMVLDYGHVGPLMMLDLSAAFDNVDPPILEDAMQRRFGVRGNALNWVDLLMGRTQVIRANGCEYPIMTLISSM
jgi:hypothetical protein